MLILRSESQVWPPIRKYTNRGDFGVFAIEWLQQVDPEIYQKYIESNEFWWSEEEILDPDVVYELDKMSPVSGLRVTRIASLVNRFSLVHGLQTPLVEFKNAFFSEHFSPKGEQPAVGNRDRTTRICRDYYHYLLTYMLKIGPIGAAPVIVSDLLTNQSQQFLLSDYLIESEDFNIKKDFISLIDLPKMRIAIANLQDAIDGITVQRDEIQGQLNANLLGSPTQQNMASDLEARWLGGAKKAAEWLLKTAVVIDALNTLKETFVGAAKIAGEALADAERALAEAKREADEKKAKEKFIKENFREPRDWKSIDRGTRDIEKAERFSRTC
jgi:hypothetical protein